MKRRRCISCGNVIKKSAVQDPYLCRTCANVKIRYSYLDKKKVKI